MVGVPDNGWTSTGAAADRSIKRLFDDIQALQAQLRSEYAVAAQELSTENARLHSLLREPEAGRIALATSGIDADDTGGAVDVGDATDKCQKLQTCWHDLEGADGGDFSLDFASLCPTRPSRVFVEEPKAQAMPQQPAMAKVLSQVGAEAPSPDCQWLPEKNQFVGESPLQQALEMVMENCPLRDTSVKPVLQRIQRRLFPFGFPPGGDVPTVTACILQESMARFDWATTPEEMDEFLCSVDFSLQLREASPGFDRIRASASSTASLGMAGARMRRALQTRREESISIQFDKFAYSLFDPEVRRTMHSDQVKMYDIVREMLISGVANKIVAEMTNMPVKDLASPEKSMSIEDMAEPVMVLMVVFHTTLIGVQSDSSLEGWVAWEVLDVIFNIVYLIEFSVRIFLNKKKLWEFCFGPGCTWNWLDVSLLVLSLLEYLTSVPSDALRILRLLRLFRLFRVFRLSACSDLAFMLKGLMGGLRILVSAMVLLFSLLYAIALLMINTIGKSDRSMELFGEDAEHYFSTVPRCMFVAFRCFLGECGDAYGVSLISLMSKELGVQFELPFVIATMVINFGIFNLIIAVYVEATLEAARQSASPEEVKAHTRLVATSVKRLVKRAVAVEALIRKARRTMPTCVMKSVTGDLTEPRGDAFRVPLHAHELEDVTSEVDINKDLFTTMLLDPVIQNCLDDLQVPPNRINLFEALDSDGSGSIGLIELIGGILAIRGEVKKSDTIACLLSVRCLQGNLAEHREDMDKVLRGLNIVVGDLRDDMFSLKESFDQITSLRSPVMPTLYELTGRTTCSAKSFSPATSVGDLCHQFKQRHRGGDSLVSSLLTAPHPFGTDGPTRQPSESAWEAADETTLSL